MVEVKGVNVPQQAAGLKDITCKNSALKCLKTLVMHFIEFCTLSKTFLTIFKPRKVLSSLKVKVHFVAVSSGIESVSEKGSNEMTLHVIRVKL